MIFRHRCFEEEKVRIPSVDMARRIEQVISKGVGVAVSQVQTFLRWDMSVRVWCCNFDSCILSFLMEFTFCTMFSSLCGISFFHPL